MVEVEVQIIFLEIIFWIYFFWIFLEAFADEGPSKILLSKALESFGSFDFFDKSTGYAGGYHEILLSKALESFGSFEFLVKSTGNAGGYRKILLSAVKTTRNINKNQ